jgi:hypothetical protein
MQLEMVEKIFKVINKKLTVMEMYLIKALPEIVKIFEQEKILRMTRDNNSKRNGRLRQAIPEIIPKLFEYSKDSNAIKPKKFKLGFANIRAFRYSYCSDLLFLFNSQNTIIVYDLYQTKVVQEISQWPWSIKNLILRRNLNFYNSKSILKVEFNKIDDYMDIDSEVKNSSNIVTENDICNFAYNVQEINEYFSEFSNNVWFHKNNKRDNYIMVFQFEKKNQLIFFYYSYKFRKIENEKKNAKNGNSLQRGSSMMNLSRSVSLHKQKKSKMSRMFTKEPSQK